MFSYLKGIVSFKKSEYFVLDVNGIGFKINCSPGMLARVPARGEETIIHTYMVVREDMTALYGFITQDELSMFEMLLGVTGVGPKLAGSITGSLEPSLFAMAVLNADVSLLSSVKGLGKKGAERIIVELKDKIKGSSFEPPDSGGASVLRSGAAEDSKYKEACSALVVLGYSSSDAASVVSKVYEQDLSLENIIKAALKELI